MARSHLMLLLLCVGALLAHPVPSGDTALSASSSELSQDAVSFLQEEGEDEMESENGDDGRAQLAELPEGLRTLAGELRALKVQSTRLAKVPAWVGELSQLEALELDGGERNIKLRTLPAEIGQDRTGGDTQAAHASIFG
mgnify:CR=1 FL=1